MMRIAVLADIHGNLPALEAVLADVKAAEPSLIVLNGDLADGPFPKATLDLLTTLGEQAVWLRGNGDRWLVEAHQGRFRHPDPATDDMIQWASALVTSEQRARLGALPLVHRAGHPHLGRIAFCHATTRSDNEMLLVDSSVEQAKAAFSGLNSEAVFVGHCHMPFDRVFDRLRIVNVGSVGMPYGHSGASWALLSSDIVLRRTYYDIDQSSDRILKTGMPGAEEFVRTYIRDTPTKREVLDAFGEVRRQQQTSGRFD